MAIRLVVLGYALGALPSLAQSPCSPRVVGADGRPVPEVEVEVYAFSTSSSLLLAPRAAVTRGRSDAEGRVPLALPSLARLAVVLDGAGHGAVLAPFDSLSAPCPVWTLPAASSLRQKILDERGAPLAGARACLVWQAGVELLGWARGFERCAESAVDGSFEIRGATLASGTELRVEREGFVPLRRSLPLASNRALRLERGRLIEGRVVGPRDVAVAGAVLRSAEGLRAQTDPTGAFRLRVATSAPTSAARSLAGRLSPSRLGVSAPGFQGRTIALDPSTTPLRIRLEPGATVAGALLSAHGEPLAEVTLRLQREVEAGKWRAEWHQPVLEEGRFLLDLPGAGRYRLQARASGHRLLDLPVLEVGAVAALDLGVLALSRGAGVVGRVLDAASGQPIEGALVRLVPRGLEGVRRLAEAPAEQRVSDAAGGFELAGQAAGAYELRIERARFAPHARSLELREDAVEGLGEVMLSAGCQVAGRVIDRADQPRAGVVLRWSVPEGESLEAIAEARTDTEGRFEPVVLAPGSYRVEGWSDRVLVSQSLEIELGEAARELNLVADGTRLSGQVVRRGEPIAGGTLLASAALDAGERSGKLLVRGADGQGGRSEVHGSVARSWSAVVDTEGRFELPDLPSGLVKLGFVGLKGEEVWRTLDVPPEAEAWATIELAGVALEGAVHEGDSALDEVVLEVRDGLGNRVGAAVSDANGRFVVADLPAGPLVLEASRAGYARRTVAGLEPGRDSRPVLVELEPADAASLSLGLTRSGGEPLAYALVSLFRAAGGLERSLALDARGEKRFEGLAEGAYYLVWQDAVVGVGASPLLMLTGSQEVRFERRLEEAVPLVLECAEDRCRGASLGGLSLLTADGIDLAAHLEPSRGGAVFGVGGLLPVGLVAPGRYVLVAQAGGARWERRIEAAGGRPAVVLLGGQSTAR